MGMYRMKRLRRKKFENKTQVCEIRNWLVSKVFVQSPTADFLFALLSYRFRWSLEKNTHTQNKFPSRPMGSLYISPKYSTIFHFYPNIPHRPYNTVFHYFLGGIFYCDTLEIGMEWRKRCFNLSHPLHLLKIFMI